MLDDVVAHIARGAGSASSPAGVLEVAALLALLTFRRLTGTDGLALARLVEDEESSSAVLDPRMQHSSTVAARHWTQQKHVSSFMGLG